MLHEIMQNISALMNLFLHIDQHLLTIIHQFGNWSYVILFCVIFMETGFVVTPFFPGDSLLFAAGALAARGCFDIFILYGLLLVAAIVGNIVNYFIGRFIGPKVYERDGWILKKKYFDQTHEYFNKHGVMTIVLSRFVPIIRTFAPFVAGVGWMNFGVFAWYNFLGGFAWVTLMMWSGYFFGNLPVVQENFHYVVLGIIVVSILPMVYNAFSAHGKSDSMKSR